ncbi:MAG: membrane protein [Halioglobus sp.]
MSAQEFETTPVTPQQLQPARYFAASYAGEHVAGTEFVIGAMFVAWGVPTMDVLWGLLWGNLLAVLTWALVCAPIATDTRLTLYAYLEKIAGPGTIRLYSAVNGVLFCVLAGAMITVSASAVRILFDIPPQVHWYPTSAGFVLVAAAVGAVVVTIAALGFRRVAQFAEVCAPWMILMFIVGALALLPSLVAQTAGVDSIGSFADFKQVADTHIWRGDGSELNVWHVAAFAWVCNLAMHGGLGDMTLLRFARSSRYGYFSALGMFIGHYLAWVCAGIMGAGAALALQTSITQLDAGAVAFHALGAAGIVAVIIAGWTTSNPTIYRAGLAFQSLNPSWDRVRVTIVTGTVTTVIACFPFVFSKLMDFVGLMGLILSPIGAVIVAEHWLLPRIGLTRYWSHYAEQRTNKPAVIAWLTALLAAFLLNQFGLHLFFLLLPTWIVATVAYIVLARAMGAQQAHAEKARAERQRSEERKRAEAAYLATPLADRGASSGTGGTKLPTYRAIALLALAACTLMGVAVLLGSNLEFLRQWLLLPSLLYFVFGTLWAREKESDAQANAA